MFEFLLNKRKKKRIAKQEKENEKNIAFAKEKKLRYQERKAKIMAYLECYDADLQTKSKSKYEEAKNLVDEKNSTCPRCGSKNVVHKVKRTKGEIKGEGKINSYGSVGGSFLGFGGSFSSRGHSFIDGEFDTLQINRCKDCEEEWNILNVDDYIHKIVSPFSNYESILPGFFFRRMQEYYEMEYDPYDFKNECNSLEEMREKFIEGFSNSNTFDEYKKCPRYMIEYVLYKGFTEHYHFIEDMDKKLFNYHKDDDEFSYTMSDEMWEVAKKMIGWQGTNP